MSKTQTATTIKPEFSGGVSFVMHTKDQELKEKIKYNLCKMSRHLEKMDKLGEKELDYLHEEAKNPNYKGTREKLIKLYDKYLKCLIVLDKCYNKLKTIEDNKEASIMFDSNLKNSIESQFDKIHKKYIKYTMDKKFEH